MLVLIKLFAVLLCPCGRSCACACVRLCVCACLRVCTCVYVSVSCVCKYVAGRGVGYKWDVVLSE